MKYLLDTGLLIEFEHKNIRFIKQLKETVKDFGFSALYTTLFNYAEFYYGYLQKKARRQKRGGRFSGHVQPSHTDQKKRQAI